MFLFIDNRVKIASLHGIEAIIKAMSTHKEKSGVQEYACCALRGLAANNAGISSSSVVLLISSVVVFGLYQILQYAHGNDFSTSDLYALRVRCMCFCL